MDIICNKVFSFLHLSFVCDAWVHGEKKDNKLHEVLKIQVFRDVCCVD
jgi:hypothetical protein